VSLEEIANQILIEYQSKEIIYVSSNTPDKRTVYISLDNLISHDASSRETVSNSLPRMIVKAHCSTPSLECHWLLGENGPSTGGSDSSFGIPTWDKSHRTKMTFWAIVRVSSSKE